MCHVVDKTVIVIWVIGDISVICCVFIFGRYFNEFIVLKIVNVFVIWFAGIHIKILFVNDIDSHIRCYIVVLVDPHWNSGFEYTSNLVAVCEVFFLL